MVILIFVLRRAHIRIAVHFLRALDLLMDSNCKYFQQARLIFRCTQNGLITESRNFNKYILSIHNIFTNYPVQVNFSSTARLVKYSYIYVRSLNDYVETQRKMNTFHLNSRFKLDFRKSITFFHARISKTPEILRD